MGDPGRPDDLGGLDPRRVAGAAIQLLEERELESEG
jgi:hypothetical protein